jgi:glycosyltransferase involved in cell wall biosynthesis
MRVAFVVPRYGADLLAGPEHQTRLAAERLAGHHQVDVLTTCAADARTWANVYAEGSDRLRGVTVRRFATARTTDPVALARAADRIFFGRHSRQEEVDWLRQRGPWSPALADYLERQHAHYDVLVFVTVLQPAAILGVRCAPSKAVLVPALADGPELELKLVQECLAGAAGFAWQSDLERTLVSSRVHLRHLAEDVVGCGVDLPDGDLPEDPGEWRLVGASDREALPPHLDGAANAFRRRYRLYGPFVLQAGRIEAGKGHEELLEYFQHYVANGGDARLVMMGSKLMPLPDDPGVKFGGALPDEERLHSLEAASVVVISSPDDSQLMLALEALSVGTPILVNARATTIVHHCRESQAGLFYADRWEFTEALRLLIRETGLRSAMSGNARRYVSRHYRWPAVLARYERLFEQLRAPGRAEPESDRPAPPHRRERNDADRRREQTRHRGRDRGPRRGAPPHRRRSQRPPGPTGKSG